MQIEINMTTCDPSGEGSELADIIRAATEDGYAIESRAVEILLTAVHDLDPGSLVRLADQTSESLEQEIIELGDEARERLKVAISAADAWLATERAAGRLTSSED